MDIDRIIQALVQTKNEAADEVLLEALKMGSEQEKPALLAALFKRATIHGLRGVIETYDSMSEPMQQQVLAGIRQLHSALRECGRSDNPALRLAAMKLIALGKQGKLAFVLSENLHNPNEVVAKAAVDAMTALALWVTAQTQWLQHCECDLTSDLPQGDAPAIYRELLAQRPEIESAVARALDLSRGRHGPELLNAALVLADWPASKTLAILQTAKHGGQTPMIRRLEQPPSGQTVGAFLLAASHCQLRNFFAPVFAHTTDSEVFTALLDKTHWLKDPQLQICMHQVARGAWWGENELLEDIKHRDTGQAAKIGDWLAASGAHDVVQDDRMDRLRERASHDFAARLRLLRLAAGRKRGAAVNLLKTFLSDPDEQLARMAARELIRRRPPEYQNLLLAPMATAPLSVRRVIARALGPVGFEQFWQRFDQMDAQTRASAGKAMLKILPDAPTRLNRRLMSGSVEQRIKALQMTRELGLSDALRASVTALSEHANPRVRAKAVTVLSDTPEKAGPALLARVLSDLDPRVRACAIEVLESSKNPRFIALLAERAKSGASRERANAIRALHRMQSPAAATALQELLKDQRPEHRVSGLWVLRQIGMWSLFSEVSRLAKTDPNLRVRRYALTVLKNIVDLMRQQNEKSA